MNIGAAPPSTPTPAAGPTLFSVTVANGPGIEGSAAGQAPTVHAAPASASPPLRAVPARPPCRRRRRRRCSPRPHRPCPLHRRSRRSRPCRVRFHRGRPGCRHHRRRAARPRRARRAGTASDHRELERRGDRQHTRRESNDIPQIDSSWLRSLAEGARSLPVARACGRLYARTARRSPRSSGRSWAPPGDRRCTRTR